MENLESVDTQEKLELFEKSINNFIIEIIESKENIDKLNKSYE